MKRMVVLGIMGLAASVLCAAGADLKNQVTNAVRQVAGKANYSWATTTTESDGRPGPLGVIEGQSEKGGATGLNFSVSGIPVQVFMKGDKGTAKVFEGWQSFDEVAAAGGSAQAVVRYLKAYKAPVAESTALVGNAKELKEVDGALTGELQEAAVKELLLIGSRQREGAEPPKTSDAKGTVKFWIKDGGLTKFEFTVQGKVTSGDRENVINRTTTVEIKNVGDTKMDVPAEAKAKLT